MPEIQSCTKAVKSEKNSRKRNKKLHSPQNVLSVTTSNDEDLNNKNLQNCFYKTQTPIKGKHGLENMIYQSYFKCYELLKVTK